MIGNRDEYESMFQVERKLWWYRILHQKVIQQIQSHFPGSQSIHILDAGCGTGGLLDALRQAGYAQIAGFDASVDAVAFARERQVAAELHDLRAFASFHPGETFDVIICNDVLCYFRDEELLAVLNSFRKRLRPGGIFISNNNAFPALRGTHDMALNILRRFVKAEFIQFAPQAGFSVEQLEYWNFCLTVPIWLLRKAQLLGQRLSPSPSVQSDVKLPPLWMNELIFNWLMVENRFFRTPPFGSSLFTVMR
ncbi:class I SAM-dependent methyltransferase [Larkinella punicea]|uniref:Class I SAM-dependent methyltransferase n=2 Tax=Larkinella punicea TaxID=2315727 RepID=A0A368JXT7_9BACT|nr:class I SAM-dependent methyltransferase [Larkinella punicea]